MRLIEWEVPEDGYEEQIVIPKEKRDLAAEEGINTENKQKVTIRVINLTSGESFTGRLPITGNRQIYFPVEIQKMHLGRLEFGYRSWEGETYKLMSVPCYSHVELSTGKI